MHGRSDMGCMGEEDMIMCGGEGRGGLKRMMMRRSKRSMMDLWYGGSLNLRLAPPHEQFREGTLRVGHSSRYLQLLESARADH
eukprot:7008356-Pyramimonas_sp.AAC.1